MNDASESLPSPLPLREGTGEGPVRRANLAETQGVETSWWGPAPAQAPTIVLLHEGLGCVALWRGFPAALADATGCGVVAYSRAGYGQSPPIPLPRPLTYMHDEARDTLPALLDEWRIERAILLGHSDGASIAAIYAGSRQDFRIQGLVLIAPHFFVEPFALVAIAAAKTAYETGDLRARLARHHRDVDVAFRGWNEAWLDPGFPAAFDLTPEIAHIRVPVLIVQGEADPYGTAEQPLTAAREAYCPVEILMVPGAKHAPHLETPEPVLAAIADFVHHLLAPSIAGRIRAETL
jgi:pimeloyl-ACP methyl ester carboxylesterase